MLINDLTNAGAIPSLEATIRFAGARQRLIAHNIANAATPDFRPADADPRGFQRALGRAIDERRRNGTSETAPLRLRATDEVAFQSDGSVRLTPRSPSGNILAHDRNDRDVEKLMADQAENVGVFRAGIELLRSRYDVIRAAISERV